MKAKPRSLYRFVKLCMSDPALNARVRRLEQVPVPKAEGPSEPTEQLLIPTALSFRRPRRR